MTAEDSPVNWQPLNVRDTPKAADYETLVDGIPEWLERSLWRWAMDRAVRTPELVYKVERLLHITMPQASQGSNLFDLYWSISGPKERLTLLDFFLRDLQDAFEDAKKDPRKNETLIDFAVAAARLNDILTEGGSIWKTTFEPYWSLVRRVNETTQAHVDLASSPSTDAARKIASAWQACYRHDPDYDAAYRDAVLAVEAVALPVTIPDIGRGTLGTAVAHIRDTVGKWTVGGLDADQQASGETLLAMLKTLWHNQQRHAQTDGSIADVSQHEAETAVTLAVTLVHWFASGLVRRVDS